MSQYLCIVAGQRAGTTALGGALESTGTFFNFKEIFKTNPPHLPGSFIAFSRKRKLCVADMSSMKQADEVAIEYLAYLRELAKNRMPLLDVKLNSLHVLKPFWSYAHQIPFFMNVLLKTAPFFS